MWLPRSWVNFLILATLVLQKTGSFSTSSATLQRRLWMESASSNVGWKVDLGYCGDLARPKTRGLSARPSPRKCKGELFESQGWTLASGATKGVHYPALGEGLVLLVYNQRNAKLLLHKVFPLGHHWFYWSDFQWYVKNIEPGRLVVMTISVAGTLGLRQTTQMLARLGSVFAPHLTLQSHWNWSFIKGGITVSESAVITNQNAVHQHATLPLSLLPDPRLGARNGLEEMRWQYCTKEGGMGNLCNEYDPIPLPISNPPSLGSKATAALADIPIVLTAGKRHHYLRHTLMSILTSPGIQTKNLLVILGDAPPSTTKLLDLLDVRFTILPVSGNHNNKLFMYYRSVYEYIAQNFSHAKAVIILDEDVEVSPDFFSYMSQTLWLLEEDSSLYCINAYSATGIKGISHHPSRLFRGSVQVEWGYAISLDFVKEALSMWPKENDSIKIIIYDFYLYMYASKGRECVYPEVGRAFHYGAGTNTMTNLLTMERAFLSKVMVQEYGIELNNAKRLLLPNWQQDLKHNISQATPLLGNPCKKDIFPSSNPDKNPTVGGHHLFTFYYRLNGVEESKKIVPDVTQFFHLYNCFGAWSLSEQGQHEGVGIISWSSDVTLYLVGVPFSPYSELKPDWVPIWDINAIPEEEFEVVDDNKLQSEKYKVHIPNQNTSETNIIKALSIS